MVELNYEKLTIYEVEEFYEFIKQKFHEADTVLEIDFKNIQKIDMVAIQLLLSLQHSCKKKSLKLVMKNFSSELLDTLKACGCNEILEVNSDK